MNTPESALETLAAAFAAGDVDAVVGHYEPDAVFVQQDGSEVRGEAAIRQALSEFFAMKPRLTFHAHHIVQVGDVALRMGKWTLTGTAPDGSSVEMQGIGHDIARQQEDGSWKMVVDNPWGAAVFG